MICFINFGRFHLTAQGKILPGYGTKFGMRNTYDEENNTHKK